MKYAVLCIIFIGSLIFRKDISGADLQERSRTFNVSKGGRLEVSLNSGDITLNTWDRNEVLVKVDGSFDDKFDKISMSQSGNTVKINSRNSWGGMDDIRITIPSQFNLDLRTSSGDLTINGTLTGTVIANTNGGDITFNNIRGNVDVNTNGGDIHFGDISGNAKINTMGGDIYSGSISGEVDAQTMGGDIRIKSSKNSVNATTYGGDIRIGDAGSSIDVTTYGGDIEVGSISGNAKVNTYGGDIIVQGASGQVLAKTAGGDLRLHNISGSINANTASGDVTAELISIGKTTSKITSSMGTITLSLPGNAKATVYAKIRLRGSWGDDDEDYFIRSDFKAQKYSRGNNGKDIVAVYEINGGGEQIILETVNSDIFIKKLVK